MRDRMLRKACGSFVLMVAGELPGEPEVEKSLSLAGVFDWYRDYPEQIVRAVVIGGGHQSGEKGRPLPKQITVEQSGL
jgi:hypothetical protein